MAEIEEELKSHLMKVKGKCEKFGLKFNIQKTKFMASGPTMSRQIDGEAMRDFIFYLFIYFFFGSKNTADGDCSHEIKRHCLLGRKVMTILDSIFKSRNITLTTGLSSQSYGLPSMFGCELDSKES